LVFNVADSQPLNFFLELKKNLFLTIQSPLKIRDCKGLLQRTHFEMNTDFELKELVSTFFSSCPSCLRGEKIIQISWIAKLMGQT